MDFSLNTDLAVDIKSDALLSKRIGLIISGSIGAIESPKLIRALRRLQGDIYPYITQGGGLFVTQHALSWAAAKPSVSEFEGNASHICSHDGVVIAPASANFISKMAHGLTDSPALALVASALGQKKKVLYLPNMHDSLAHSPMIIKNMAALTAFATQLKPRAEEGKQKFPDPATLADEIAHQFNASLFGNSPILIVMGGTHGQIDDVRHIGNYSSGALGTEIAHELYRQGLSTHIICGPCAIKPTVYTSLTEVVSPLDMQTQALEKMKLGISGVVMLAAVLDFVPKEVVKGKISSAREKLSLELVPTEKIIAKLHPKKSIKIGFKLESDLTYERASQLAKNYLEKYNLSMVVVNDISQVSPLNHKGYIYLPQSMEHPDLVENKSRIAQTIFTHIKSKLWS